MSQLTSLCWEHGLYDAVLYVYNRGMSDYVSPLEQLLAILRTAIDSDSELSYQQVHTSVSLFTVFCQYKTRFNGCALALINVVNRHRARLILGWVTVYGQINHVGTSPST